MAKAGESLRNSAYEKENGSLVDKSAPRAAWRIKVFISWYKDCTEYSIAQ